MIRNASFFATGLLGLMAVSVAADQPADSSSPVAAQGHVDLVVRNARLFDGRNAKLRERATILMTANRILAIVDEPALSDHASPYDLRSARIVDAGNRVVIPGLIDAHIHPTMAVAPSTLRDNDPSYVAARAGIEARLILMRGFTTIRDAGGPVFGLKQAIDEGLLEGPHIFPSGAIISQTGGHGDFRQRVSTPPRRWTGELDVEERLGYALVADGPDEVAAAAREQLRLGATQIKLTAGGGISSAYDPIDSVQFFDSELRAAVQAAADWGTYVMVHAYTASAIRRSIEAGVRSIEHGHLIDEPTMKLIADRGVFLSPQAYVFSGALTPSPTANATAPTLTQLAQRAKAEKVAAGLDNMMKLAKKYNVKVAFGTDVFGGARVFAMESREFGARLRWFTPLEILRQATSVNGELLAMSGPRNPYGKVGVLEAGASADLLIVEGNPLEDIRLLEDPQANLRLIVKDGRVIKSMF